MAPETPGANLLPQGTPVALLWHGGCFTLSPRDQHRVAHLDRNHYQTVRHRRNCARRYSCALLRRNDSMSASEETYGKVVRVLVEALNVEEDEITPAARLQDDLGAESIDFLDIVFRLEREFAIKIPRGELFPESVFQGDPDFVREGRVTDKGLSELRSRMPYADVDG